MKTGLYAALVAALCVAAAPAMAASEACSDAAKLKTKVEKHGLSWTLLTDDQRLFAAGLYVATPPVSGLPFGDKAVLVQSRDGDAGLVYFIDGSLACMPFAVTAQVAKMLIDVGSGKVNHEGIEE